MTKTYLIRFSSREYGDISLDNCTFQWDDENIRIQSNGMQYEYDLKKIGYLNIWHEDEEMGHVNRHFIEHP